MALVCSRCGTSNPDGNQFCQACGTPLAAAAPTPAAPVGATAASPFTQPPPPVSTAPPGPPAGPPASFQSPYYAPSGTGGQPAVHRTPWMLIIAAVVVLVLVMAGFATVLALVFGSHNTQSSGFSSVSSPSPAVSPTPGQSPSPQPTQNPTGSTASNDGLTVVVPTGWTVLSKDSESITLESPNSDGTITIGSGPSSPPLNAQQNKDELDKVFTQKYPDTKTCPGSSTSTGALDGVPGIYWELCFTLTSGQQSIQVGAPLWVGANSSGSVYYVAALETEVSNMDNFITESKPILDGGITWKLS